MTTWKKWIDSAKPIHKEIILQTPFGLLVDVEPLKIDRAAFLALLSVYSSDLGGFMIGGKIHMITVKDIHMILGLPMTGSAFDFTINPLQRNLKVKYFEKSKVTLSKLEEKMTLLVESVDNKEDAEDFVKLLLLSFMSSFLFSGGDYLVLEGLFAYVEDLAKISSYNWSEAILLFLLEGVNSLAWKLQNADSPQEAYLGYFKDCSVILTI